MNTCNTCKFWIKPDRKVFTSECCGVRHKRRMIFGQCANPMLDVESSIEPVGTAKDEDSYVPRNGACPDDSRSNFQTGPDFGCIHFQKKP